MKVGQKKYRTIWMEPRRPQSVFIIDQRLLPHRFVVLELKTVEQVYDAILSMKVRGAPLIGVTAAFGMYLAACRAPVKQFQKYIRDSAAYLRSSRPTAVNLAWALEQQLKCLAQARSKAEAMNLSLERARQITEADVAACRSMGDFGLAVIRTLSQKKSGKTVNILTHCNAGWLACVDWGTATAPIYRAYQEKIKIHVWVDETRPRNQGASLTAWELGQERVPHTVIADNTGGHLMQHGRVDMVIVGTDRTTRTGDVANKIGTYLKALAARDNNIPFYVAAPSSSIDWKLCDGVREIPIEERDQDEVRMIQGWNGKKLQTVLLTPPGSSACNYAFDVTPSRLVTGIITERGIAKASESSLLKLFPEHRACS